jgi:hypothetical protein
MIDPTDDPVAAFFADQLVQRYASRPERRGVMVMSEHPDRADLGVQSAKLGAMLASKGLTPEQVVTVMREQVQPVLAEAVRRVEADADVDALEFVVRHSGQT